jgi:hypothetical protein
VTQATCLKRWKNGEKSEIIIGGNIFNNSTTTHLFQAIISTLDRYTTTLDVLQVFNHCNLTSINDDMTILVNTIVTPFQGIIPVFCKKGNNSTITSQIHPKIPEFEALTFLNGIQVFEHQNPTNIGKHTTSMMSINGEPSQHLILFAVMNLITPQPLACFNPHFRRRKDILL